MGPFCFPTSPVRPDGKSFTIDLSTWNVSDADMTSLLEGIQRAFAEVSGVDQMKNYVEEALKENTSPLRIVESMREGLTAAGRKYEQGEFFLSELVMSGIMAQELSKMLKPHLEGSTDRFFAKIAIGTVKGDLHDIGKNLVSTMLSSAGFEIQDLGVDVPPEKFVEVVGNEKPRMIAMSCLLTVAMDAMKNVMDRLAESGCRSGVKVLVGGRPITPDFVAQIGADGYGADAMEAVSAAKSALTK
jgi:5-methyltetrahydrofolate--homocysteine methyltransferase